MQIDFFSLLVLLGACQGILFSLYLFLSKSEGIKGKNYLGFFMLILAYNGFETFSWSSGINNPYLNLFFECFHYMMTFGLGPSLLLYVKSLISKENKLQRTVLLYYTPLIVRFLMRAAIIFYALLWDYDIISTDISPMDVDYLDIIVAEPLSVMVFCIYLFLAFQEYDIYNKSRLSTVVANYYQEEITAKWLKIFLQSMATLAVIWIATVLSPMIFNIEYGPHFYLIEVLLVFLIYWVAFASYYRIKIVYVQPQKTTSGYLNNVSAEDMAVYSSLIEKALKHDKLYLDATLTVNKMAEKLKINPKMVSAVINGHFNKSFNELVNQYRLEEVKKRLLDPRHAHLTISGIALESGFNSQATFQRVFKHNTGMAPKEYIASQVQKSV